MDRIAPRFARLDGENCWTIAEHRGSSTPDGLQHLLSRAGWDADGVRDDLRDYVVDAFGDPGAVLVVDETGDVKKGTATVGVQRQYSGAAGRIENSQVAVYPTYAAPRGHALIDRALYLPTSWTKDPNRCADAGMPKAKRRFATKPGLATELITRRGWPATRSTAPTRTCARRSAATVWDMSWRSRPTGAYLPTPDGCASTRCRH